MGYNLTTMKKVPCWLQPILWSADVADLDLKRNRGYIINQILSLGTLKELRWLFSAYPKQILRKIFIEKPSKIYTPSSFHFVKNTLLGLKNKKLFPKYYVKSLPRDIRPKKVSGL